MLSIRQAAGALALALGLAGVVAAGPAHAALWVAGHYGPAGEWIPGHYERGGPRAQVVVPAPLPGPVVVERAPHRVWVPGHAGPYGRWVAGAWVVR
jgi:hypothetical protein